MNVVFSIFVSIPVKHLLQENKAFGFLNTVIMTRVFFFLGFSSSLKQQRFFSLSAKKKEKESHNT
jgi:hypothetical protein